MMPRLPYDAVRATPPRAACAAIAYTVYDVSAGGHASATQQRQRMMR